MDFPFKVGLIGYGNLAQSLIQGWTFKNHIPSSRLFVSNRSEGKLAKAKENLDLQFCASNEELVEKVDIVILAVKPQDISSAIDSVQASFNPNQIVLSLAAGVPLDSLEKKMPNCRVARVMPNTATAEASGVIGFCHQNEDEGLSTLIDDLFSPLGYTLEVEDEEQLNSLVVGCASGTGFLIELMTYWQEWLEERGFEPATAKQLALQTFVGSSLWVKAQSQNTFEELLNKVASKKGVTAAGLESMRELELERVLRVSLEKASLRNQELAKLL
jgi:pyrroline-5-carboxylate reductase